MKEIPVVLTDYAITLLCLYFIVKLVRLPSINQSLRFDFVGLFFSIGLAAAIGGTVHGFFAPESALFPMLWMATLLSIGVTAFYVWSIALNLSFSSAVQPWLRLPLWAGLVAYAYVISNISQDFRVAITAYLPGVIFLIFALLFKHLKTKEAKYLIGIIGLLITLVAAYFQQLQIGIHPEYFDHNALYHVIQGFGLYFIYKFSLKVIS